jgi:valyl-tRNA synthetase
MERFACREKLWADMEAAGLTIKKSPHPQRAAQPARRRDDRAAGEPQWFVNAEPPPKWGWTPCIAAASKSCPTAL